MKYQLSRKRLPKEYKRIKRYSFLGAREVLLDPWHPINKQWAHLKSGDIVRVKQLAKGEVFAVVCESHLCSKCVLNPCVAHYGSYAKCCVPLEDFL